jgi:4-cresol dehydrogenase (hydroxylating)
MSAQLLADRPHATTDVPIEELRYIVGRDLVSCDPAVLGRLARTTLPHSTAPAALVRPSTTSEVQEIVRWAARHGVAVYPISRGKNWGYGDACPPRNGCVLLDLSRMDRIVEVNAELAYAVLEPGVTQGQLFRYLEDNNIPLWMDATGAGPDTSIVGNILERGVGLSPYGDRFAHCCAMEVVLPDGRLLRTGLGAYPGAQAEHLYKHGVGPALDGLFTQANLGIVTRLTFWLMPKPACFCAFFLELARPEGIGPLVEVMRRLRLAGTLRCSVHCFNNLRILGGVERFPWDRADGRQALEAQHPEVVSELLERHRIPAWVATGSLTGTAAEVRAARAELCRAVRGLPGRKVRFVGPKKLALLRTVRRLLGRCGLWNGLCRRLDRAAMWVDFLQGRSSYQTLTGAHWRARGTPGSDQDPLDSGAGLIWVCPVLPATAAAVEEVLTVGRREFHRHGFEFQVTLSQISERALCAVLSIHFDRRSREETTRAANCHDALAEELLQRGYIPYRGAPRTQQLLHDHAPVYWDVARRLKEALDSTDTLAPGRYVPAGATVREDQPCIA